MSIWCSWPNVGHEEHAEEPLRGGEVRTFADGFSNHHPDLTGENELPAAVGLCHIAPWCVPGHDEDCARCKTSHDHPEVGEWVRLTVSAEDTLSWWGANEDGERPRHVGPQSMSVVMDEAAARQLAADLLEWANMPKVRP